MDSKIKEVLDKQIKIIAPSNEDLSIINKDIKEIIKKIKPYV